MSTHKIEKTVAGETVEFRSWSTNYLLYKSVGGEVRLKNRKKRKWWCGWLCKRGSSKTADRMTIQNNYFGKIDGKVLLGLASGEKACVDSQSCKHSLWGVGLTLKFSEATEVTPGFPPEFLTVDGVVSNQSISMDGDFEATQVESGSTP